jgi:cytochrome P450
MSYLNHVLLTLLAALVLKFLHKRNLLAKQRQRFETDHGCKHAPVKAQRFYLFGIDSLLESYKQKKQGTCLLHKQESFLKYGNTYLARQLGMDVLSTIDPENVECIMRYPKTFIARPIRKIALDGLVGHGILTADGDVWKRQRTIMTPSFHRKRLADFGMYEEHIQHLLASLPDDGTSVDLQSVFFKFTMDLSTAYLFGESCGSLTTQSELSSCSDLAGAFDRAQRASVTKVALGSVDWIRPQIQYWRDTRCIRRFADRYVEKALRQKHDRQAESRKSKHETTKHDTSRCKGSPSNFLQSLTDQTDDHNEIRTGLLNLLVGGRDTTASLLSNMWLSLSQDQRIWSKLQAEVASLEGVRPDVKTLKQLPYLRQCIDECK